MKNRGAQLGFTSDRPPSLLPASPLPPDIMADPGAARTGPSAPQPLLMDDDDEEVGAGSPASAAAAAAAAAPASAAALTTASDGAIVGAPAAQGAAGDAHAAARTPSVPAPFARPASLKTVVEEYGAVLSAILKLEGELAEGEC